jgi:hypothetical protein
VRQEETTPALKSGKSATTAAAAKADTKRVYKTISHTADCGQWLPNANIKETTFNIYMLWSGSDKTHSAGKNLAN